jgi:hypothetical protein
MNILILCDQIDCTFNQYDVKVFGVSGILYNTCTHPHPNIQRYPTHVGTLCNSKDRRVTDPAIIHPSCSTCESSNIDDCINCCHNKFKES